MDTLNVELPEGFKMTKIGLLPNGWDMVKLGKVAVISAGDSAPQGENYFGGTKPFIRVSHIDNESNIVKGYDFINDKAVQDYRLKLFPKGTIVFPKSGASIYLEKRAMLPIDAYIASHLCAVISNTDNVIQKFLYYALCHLKLAKEKSDGYPTLNISEVEQIIIPLPPLAEQQKIVSILSVVQEAKEKTEAVISAAKDLKKSMMKYLFTYGPVPVTYAENVPLKETEIGIVPQEWEVIGIKEVIDLRRGVSWRKAEANKEGIGIPVIGIPNIKKDGSIDFANTYFLDKNVPKEKLLQEGDIIFVGSSGSIRNVGRNLLIRELPENTFTYASFTFLGRVKQGKAINKFVYYLLNSSHVNFEKYARRASDGKYNFQLTQFKNEQKIPLPPLSEQQKIASILSAIDEKIKAEESVKQSLEVLFRSMLHNLMTAKIKVNNLKIDIDEEL